MECDSQRTRHLTTQKCNQKYIQAKVWPALKHITATLREALGILHDLESQLFIDDWLSRHTQNENRDKEISDMRLNINARKTYPDIPKCMIVEDIRCATIEDDHINILLTYVIHGWPLDKSWNHKRNVIILLILRCDSCHGWNHDER